MTTTLRAHVVFNMNVNTHIFLVCNNENNILVKIIFNFIIM